MSSRSQRHNNDLIDWRMMPLGLLSLAIGGVVSYSVGSNFGLGYVAINELPLTAQELALSNRTAPVKPIETKPPVTPATPEVAKPAAVVAESTAPVAEQPSTAPKPDVQVETNQPADPVATEPEIAVPETETVNSAEPVQESEQDLAESESANDTVTDSTPEVASTRAKTEVTQSVSVDEDGNEIVRLSVDQTLLPEELEANDLELPDTADIVARANLAAGVELKPEEPEEEESLIDVSIATESEKELEARFSTNPEDLPILRVIVPDDSASESVAQEPEAEDSTEPLTQATLSREITDAVDSGVVSRVLKLIEEGEPLDGRDRSGQTMLLKAAWNGDEEMLDALLALGADVNLSSNDGRTPLFSATVSGNLSLVNKLVQLGASVNSKTKEGKTPLMVSAWSNYAEIAVYLLEKGAQPDLIDSNGRNALFYALWDRNIDVVRTLIQYGARLDQVDREGHSAIDIARLRRIELPGMDLEAELKSIN